MAEQIENTEPEQTEPTPEPKKEEKEDMPSWAKSLQSTMENIANNLTAVATPPAASQAQEIPAPTPPPEPEEEEEEEEEEETPAPKKRSFLDWLL